jgi:hypothetical protein
VRCPADEVLGDAVVSLAADAVISASMTSPGRRKRP